MRKFIFLGIVLLSFLSSCSASSANSAGAETGAPTPTLTASVTPLPTQTFTPTPSPTIVKIPTIDYNATSTPPAYLFGTPTPQEILSSDAPLNATPTFEGYGEGFEWIKIEASKFYWGICKPSRILVTAQVSNPEEVYSISLFVRLRHYKAEIYTHWSKGSGMEKIGEDGMWAEYIYANVLDGNAKFRKGLVSYQLVATNVDNIEVGRSPVFKDAIFVEPCMCLTPPCGPKD